MVYSLKQHLSARGILGAPVARILVDADPSYRNSRFASALEPMAMVPIEGARPDLLCSASRSNNRVICAFEVKRRSQDWSQGLAQARAYTPGAHYSYLALPFRKDGRTRQMEERAHEDGIGVMVRDEQGWREVVRPRHPRPQPWTLEAVATALEGVPVARRFMLNHPLNYLVVPFLRARYPGEPLHDLLDKHWPDLGTESTRRGAIDGARNLGLIDDELHLTTLGTTAADLLEALGFDPSTRPPKRLRLADVAPAIAAVARAVLLASPVVRLIIDTLLADRIHDLSVAELFRAAAQRDEVLARALFLQDPALGTQEQLRSADFNPTTTFQFKQILWHSGILSTKRHPSSGRGAAVFDADHDRWAPDPRFIRSGALRAI